MKCFLLSLFLLHSFLLHAQEAGKKKSFVENTKTSIEDPFKLRDPFKRKRVRLRKRKKNYGGFLENNAFSNQPSIEGVSIDKIRIVGVLLGKNRRAIARILEGSRGLSKDSFILKEGMKIGENAAEIKGILPGGIVLAEKIKNVYDQDEYIETVIPVSAVSE